MGKDLKGRELGKGLRQRKDGRYEGRTNINGENICIVKPTLKECSKLFKDAKELALNNMNIKKMNITLNEWFEEWFEQYKKPFIKETSIYPTRSKYYNIFGNAIGDMKISTITNIDIQSVINDMKFKGRAPSSMRTALGIVRDCMESAKNNRLIQVNPCFDIKVYWENKNVLRRFLSKEEQELFLNKSKYNMDWYYEMFYIMLYTGMRVGEVGGLKWEDIDYDNKCIHIRRALSCQYEGGKKVIRLTTPKTHNSYRDIPFLGEVEKMLKAQYKKQQVTKSNLGDRWREEQGFENFVFTSSMGSPITRYIAEKQINKIVNAINEEEMFNAIRERREPKLFEKVYPHALRHTFCSRCFECNMNPKVVQKIMGHQHYSTTIDIYTHVTDEKLEDEVSKFNTLSELPQII